MIMPFSKLVISVRIVFGVRFFFFDVYPVRFTIGKSVDNRLGGSRYYCGVNRGRYGRDSLAGSIC